MMMISKAVRTSCEVFASVFWQSKSILFLLGLNIFIFAGLIKLLYKGTEEQQEYFSNFWSICVSLIVAQSANNLPDAMLPGYNRNRWTSLVLVAFHITSVLIIINILISFVYYNYQRHLNERETEELKQSSNATTRRDDLMRFLTGS